MWGPVAYGPSGSPPPGCGALSGGGGGSPGPAGGVKGRRLLGRPPASRGLGGGEKGERGGGRAGVPRPPPPVPWLGSPAAAWGWLVGPSPGPPYSWLRGYARPPLLRARPGLFGIPERRARPGWLLMGQLLPSRPSTCRAGGRGGGGLRQCAALPRGRGAVGRSASVRPSASLGWALKRASWASPSPWRAWSQYCSGSCPRAAALMRSAGCPCAPVQGCRPVEVTLGVGGRRFGRA